jgi:hypothetical protein
MAQREKRNKVKRANSRARTKSGERQKLGMGGKRPGAGRPKGSINKVSLNQMEKAAKAGYLPLDYMLKVMRNERESKGRRDAMAIAAAPYLHPKLSSVVVSGKKDQPLVMVTQEMTPQQAAEAFATTLVHTLDDSEYEVIGETKAIKGD